MKGYTENWIGLELSCLETCIVNSSICHPSAQCMIDTSGHYICQCRQGYIGNGYYCKGKTNIWQLHINIIINIYLNYNSLFIKHQFIASIKQNQKYLHKIYV